MEAQAVSVYALFTGFDARNPTYRIPYFQRGYAWKKDQVVQLIDDILEAQESKAPQYFLGPITTTKLKRKDEHIYDVIDGQQRLTTLLLTAHVLLELLPVAAQNPDPIANLRGRLNNLVGFTDRDAPPVRHQRQDDKEALDHIRGGNRNSGGSHRIIDAYRHIQHRLSRLEPERLSRFADFLLEDTKLIIIITTDDESSYQIFETLNNRGESLTPLDLIRNRIFKSISNDPNLLDDSHVLWLDRLKTIQSLTDKRTADITMQQLLVTRVNISQARWIDTKDLYGAIKKQFSGKTSKAAFNDLKELLSENSVKSWLHIVKAEKGASSKAAGYSDAFVIAAQYKIFHPPLFVMRYRKARAEDIDAASRLMAAYIRRLSLAVARIPVKKLGNAMSELAADLMRRKNLDGKPLIRAVRKALKYIDQDIAGVYDDEAFKRLVSERPIVDVRRAKQAFIDLQNARAESDGERLSQSDTLHIEHILPQKPADFSKWRGFTQQNHASYVNRLGNLTILGSRLNQAISNGDFARKRKEYAKSNYWITRDIAENYSHWTPKELEDRERWLLDELVKLWSLK